MSTHPALQVAKNCEVIFIAVKPQYVATVLEEIKPLLTDQHIVVSIAAGITLTNMKVKGGCILPLSCISRLCKCTAAMLLVGMRCWLCRSS